MQSLTVELPIEHAEVVRPNLLSPPVLKGTNPTGIAGDQGPTGWRAWWRRGLGQEVATPEVFV